MFPTLRWFHAVAILALVTIAGVVLRTNMAGQEIQSVLPAESKLLYSFNRLGLVQHVAVFQEVSDRTKAESVALRFAKVIGRPVFAELVLGQNEVDLRASFFGTMPQSEAEPSIADTLQQLRQVGRVPATSMARIVIIGGNALFSYREAGQGNEKRPGVQESIVIGNRDPTHFQIEGTTYRLLHVAVKQSTEHEISAAVFFKSTVDPSCSACRQLATDFASRISKEDCEVFIRRDVWFSSEFFPLVFRFEPDVSPRNYTDWHGNIVPPRIAEYYRRAQMVCRILHENFSCEGYGRYEHTP